MIKNILLLQLERNPSMFPDTFLGFVSQVIRQAGFHCARASLGFPRGKDADEKQGKLSALHDFVKKNRTDLIFYNNVLGGDVPRFIHALNPGVRHSLMNEGALDFLPPENIMELEPPAGNNPVFSISRDKIKTNLFCAAPAQLILRAPQYKPDLDVHIIGENGGASVFAMQTVFADGGCRYRKSLEDNDFFTGVHIPDDNSVMLGCSFCDKTHHAPMSRHKRVEAVKLQLRFLKKSEPVSEFHLFDENP